MRYALYFNSVCFMNQKGAELSYLDGQSAFCNSCNSMYRVNYSSGRSFGELGKMENRGQIQF